LLQQKEPSSALRMIGNLSAGQSQASVHPSGRANHFRKPIGAQIGDKANAPLERDELWLDRHPAPAFCLSMAFSENRIPPIGSKPEGMLFRIMLQETMRLD
jgi:hypothetical protein